ncbi:SRPBCC family protein [Streptosporangium sp. NPDC048865]|uniref:SRPBCC family protein n=1 Tax=Streptosporangium sp. NPDC048865 TaxID=3155766 RepID=UPI0034356690
MSTIHLPTSSGIPSRSRSRGRAALLTMPLLVAGVLGTGVTPAHAAPAEAARSGPVACGGEKIGRAPVRSEGDILIKAPLSRIWRLQTDVKSWPAWQKPVLSVDRLDRGPLRRGSSFRWTTPAPATPTTPGTILSITSTVRQVKPESCILWRGPAVGQGLRIDEGVHLWTFTKVKGGVRVHTVETWRGAQVEADVRTATALLGGSLKLWLHELKVAAEARDGRPCA